MRVHISYTYVSSYGSFTCADRFVDMESLSEDEIERVRKEIYNEVRPSSGSVVLTSITPLEHDEGDHA